jgi:hypothetical protein
MLNEQYLLDQMFYLARQKLPQRYQHRGKLSCVTGIEETARLHQVRHADGVFRGKAYAR